MSGGTYISHNLLSKMASVEAQQFAAAAAATLHDTPDRDAEPPTKRAKLSADGEEEEELDAQAVAREWKALVEQCAQKLGKKAGIVKGYVSEKNLQQLQLGALGTQTAARVLQLSRRCVGISGRCIPEPPTHRPPTRKS